MDDYARDNVRRAIVVNRGSGIPTAYVAPLSLSAPPAAPAGPSAAPGSSGAVRQPRWIAARPALLLIAPGSPPMGYSQSYSPSYPPFAEPQRCSPFPEPPASSGAAPAERPALQPPPAAAPAPTPVQSIWSWHSVAEGLQEDLQQGVLQQSQPAPRRLQRLPSFGDRTAAASEMAGSCSESLGALSSSPPSPPHALTLTDSSDADEFTALALSRLSNDGMAQQPSSFHDVALAQSDCQLANTSAPSDPNFWNSPRSFAFQLERPTASAPLNAQLDNSARTQTPRKKIGKRSGKFCAFCRGNGELPRMYTSHSLHTEMPDGSIIVTCSVLRSLTCELCGASGDFAHTRSHCPLNHQPSVAVLLKNTPRRCDGTLRKKIKDRK